MPLSVAKVYVAKAPFMSTVLLSVTGAARLRSASLVRVPVTLAGTPAPGTTQACQPSKSLQTYTPGLAPAFTSAGLVFWGPRPAGRPWMLAGHAGLAFTVLPEASVVFVLSLASCKV